MKLVEDYRAAGFCSDLVAVVDAKDAEIERLRAERDLWKSRAERMFWLLPDDVRLSQFADVNEQTSVTPTRCRICGKHSTDPCHDHKSGQGLGCRQNKEDWFEHPELDA